MRKGDAPRHGSTSGGEPTIPAFATIAQTLAAEAGGFEAVIAHSMGAAALIVHDAGDREVPHKDALELVRAWPRARLLTTEGLGHHRILRDPCVIREAAAFIGARERPSKAL